MNMKYRIMSIKMLALLLFLGSSNAVNIITNSILDNANHGRRAAISGGWQTSTTFPIIQDGTDLFAGLSDHYQLLPTNVAPNDFFQNVTITDATLDWTLSVDAMLRTDGVNTNGNVFIQVYAGELTTLAEFDAATALAPTSGINAATALALTTTVASFTAGFGNLAAGDYTVRVLATTTVGGFQAGADNITFTGVAAVPEPTSLLLLGLGSLSLMACRRRS